MVQDSTVMFVVILSVVVLALVFFMYWNRRLSEKIKAHSEETDRRVYELRMLKQLSERAGYSLDIHQVLDIITGSLEDLIEYSVVSYMLLDSEKIIFTAHVEQSVHRSFIDDVQDRMKASLEALTGHDLSELKTEDVVSGVVFEEKDTGNSVQSFFNIPLVIGGEVKGVLTVADTRSGLYKEEDMTILYAITNQASRSMTRLQEVVEKEQRKMRSMVKSIRDGIIMTDTEYRIVVANPAAQKIIDHTSHNPMTIFDLVHSLEGVIDIRERLEESMHLGTAYVAQGVTIRDSFFDISLTPVVTHTGGEKYTVGSVIIFHDVSDEVALTKARDEFTSMLVHELRSPLSGIKHITEMIDTIRKTKGEKAYHEYIGMIQSNTDQMLSLVNDILDVAKFESGEFSLSQETHKLADVVHDRIDFYNPAARDNGIHLDVVIGKDVPDELVFDKERIIQVFNNLLSNAFKFTQSGGNVDVFVVTHMAGESLKDELTRLGFHAPFSLTDMHFEDVPQGVVFGVSDTGVGIPAGKEGEIFNKFTQLNMHHASTKNQKGTGLGLAIVKGIIEAHGGVVYLASREGKGSIFCCVLPEDKEYTIGTPDYR